MYMLLFLSVMLSISCFSDEDEEDQDAVLYLPVSPDIEEPEESAWAIPPEVLNSVCDPQHSVSLPL